MFMTLERIQTNTLFNKTSFHRFEVFHSEHCACFNCGQSFTHEQITAWTDKDMTALCPHCHMDSVLPSYNDTPTDAETLAELKRYAY